MNGQEPQIEYLSLAGRKHRDRGISCEDASLGVVKNGVSAVCLADGAGGSQYTHADIGAKCIIQTVCDLMVNHFDAFYYEIHEARLRNVLVAAIQSDLALKAAALNLPGIETLSCTMLFCAVNGTRMICGHIGDGVIARVTCSGLIPIFLPQNGEDASSTIFVTLPNAQEYLRIIRSTIDDTHAIVLMTDGISDLVYDAGKMLLMPVVARLAEFGAYPQEERARGLTHTIRSFIIDKSPLSDDASIGIIYFPGTALPDSASLPTDKEICLRNYDDDIRMVQKEILPKVKAARDLTNDVFASASAGGVPAHSKTGKPQTGQDEPGLAIQEDQDRQENIMRRYTRQRRVLVAFGILSIIAVIALVTYQIL